MIKKYINTISIVGVLSLLWVKNVLAGDGVTSGNTGSSGVTSGNTGSGGGLKIENPLGDTDTLPELLVLIIDKFVLPIGGIIVTFMIIYTGFKFVMAQGDPGELQKAKQSLLNTVIGAAIVLGALSISVIIKSVVDEIIKAI